ncbi:hypothetical protein V6N13_060917 [Hibiscus sabdariffa]
MVFSASNNIVSRSTISRKFEEEADGSGDILELARKFMIHLTSFSIGDAFPCLKWMDYLTGFIPNLKATFAEVDEFLDQIIQERKDLETQKDFLSIMLQVRKDDGMELTGDNIKAILLVQKEVRIVVGNKPRIEAGDIHRMEYLKCVIKETLRLHPTAPFLIPRQTSTAVELSGYDIPSDVTRCPGMPFGVALLESLSANLLYWFDWAAAAAAAESESESETESLDMDEADGVGGNKKIPLRLLPISHFRQTT